VKTFQEALDLVIRKQEMKESDPEFTAPSTELPETAALSEMAERYRGVIEEAARSCDFVSSSQRYFGSCPTRGSEAGVSHVYHVRLGSSGWYRDGEDRALTAIDIYEGSDGAATRAYYAELEKRGPLGFIAMNLFRAQKCSSRAKKYHGGIRGVGSFREMAYERKAWSMGLLCKALNQHAVDLGLTWGWARDPLQAMNQWVLYLDLPEGQVSFHSPVRGEGPPYERPWDGLHASCDRILAMCERVMTGVSEKQEVLPL